jgi:hypothetical protein
MQHTILKRLHNESCLDRREGGGVNARTGDITDSVFGRGKKVEIRQEGGSLVSLELYDGLPFLLVRKTFKSGEIDAEIDSLTPVTFSIDLGVPAGKLKTMGPGGLLDPSRNPGSYVFLAVVDPETRRGVVAGFITQERGSGVLFSGVRGDTAVDFRARIDYGRLRLKPEASEALETFAVGIFGDARLGLERCVRTGHEAVEIASKTQSEILNYEPKSLRCSS